MGIIAQTRWPGQEEPHKHIYIKAIACRRSRARAIRDAHLHNRKYEMKSHVHPRAMTTLAAPPAEHMRRAEKAACAEITLTQNKRNGLYIYMHTRLPPMMVIELFRWCKCALWSFRFL